MTGLWSGLAIAALATLVSACGGSNPQSPTGACGGVAVGPLGCAKGMMTGTIGVQPFNGGVPTGASTYTPVAAQLALNLPAQDFIVIQGTSSDLTSLTLTVRAKLGKGDLGLGVIDAETRNVTVNGASLATRANGVATGAWNANVTGGSGSITLTSVSTTAASGSYSITLVPQAGTGAVGDRAVSGTFNVTF
ncbi:MAG: hypothetical protein ABL961_01775 [Vicinamibacterales bacterium]